VKESLSNALRHAGAEQIEIRVGCGEAQVLLTVTDNGCGFDPAAAHHGMGLANMEERVVDAGGAFRVESENGCGTTVRVSLPMS
jgi:signal transduction histidine kinase